MVDVVIPMAGAGARLAVLVALTIGAGALGAAVHSVPLPAFTVSAPVALADQAIDIRVTGLEPGEQVTVDSTNLDAYNERWRASATFAVGQTGTVDLGTEAPVSGSYQGVDPMGLFWSMQAPVGAVLIGDLPKRPQSSPAYQVTFTAIADGRHVAATTVTRVLVARGVADRQLTVRQNRVIGTLFLPPPGTLRHPAVLAFGGSEGGESMDDTAALLASHGYPTLSLTYFKAPGLPDALADIPLEYFATAARILAAQPGVDPAHILAMGYSRGSEAALLLADEFPTLIHGAVLYASNATIGLGYPDPSLPAWTLDGKPFAERSTIPVANVSGPVLAFGGEEDMVWPSYDWAPQISKELANAHLPYPHEALDFPDAGHQLGTFPYLALTTQSVQLATDTPQAVDGGTRAGDAAAQRAGWNDVLSLLGSLEH